MAYGMQYRMLQSWVRRQRADHGQVAGAVDMLLRVLGVLVV